MLRRPFVQIALGLSTGSLLLAVLFFGLGEVKPTLAAFGLLCGYTSLIGIVLLLASISPTLRVLRVDPADALRVEG